MANSKVKTNALKRIIQAPGGSLGDEELFRLVKKQDRSAESLVLKKFIQAVSEIPLVDYDQTNKTFTFSRHAHKARSYFLFMAYLFGAPIASRWPDFKKFTSKMTETNSAHFVSSYCLQTIIHEKINSYNIQMHALLDFVIKKGKGKEIIYDRIINQVLVDYFPSVNISWLWLYNEIVKEPRPKNLVQSTLTLDKAQSQLIKIVKKVAKDCEIEVQRLRVNSGSNSTTPLNWADVASAKGSTSGEVKVDPVVTEIIPLSSEYFNVMNGSEGRTLKHIEEVSGAKISLGKMKNGLTGFTSTGTKTQNDLAIKEVLKLVDENNEEKNEARKRDVKQNCQEVVEIVTYSTDILEKYVTKKESLTMLGSFTERYPGLILKVEPNKQRVVVKGKISANVKTVAEYLRESLADFASDMISKNNKKRQIGSGKTPDTPVTRPLSVGSKCNTWIHANQQELLKIALKNHVSLRFPSVKRSGTDILTISGKLQNVEQTDREVLSKLPVCAAVDPEYSARFTPLQPLQPSPPGTSKGKVETSPPQKSPDVPFYPPKPPDSPAKENVRPDKKAGNSSTDKKSDKPVKLNWFDHEEKEEPMDAKDSKISKPVELYEEMDLKSTLVEGIHQFGLEKPSTVHRALLPLLLSRQKVLVEADLGEDVCSALLIAVLQQVNLNLRQTQGFVLLRDKLLIPSTLAIIRALTVKIPLISEGLLDTMTTFPEIPHIVLSTPQLIKNALETQSIAGGKAKVLVYTDLSLTVGSFGYKIIQGEYFKNLVIDSNTKLIFQSGEPLPAKVYTLLEKFGEERSLETIKFETKEIVGPSKFSVGKERVIRHLLFLWNFLHSALYLMLFAFGVTTPEKPFQSPLNNLSERQLDLARRNLYLVYSVIKGYPELELIQQGADLILSGKVVDVKAAKNKIQEMIILHDKVYVEQAKPPSVKSPSPVRTMAQVASMDGNTNGNQSAKPRENSIKPSTRPPNTTRPPSSPAPSSSIPTFPLQVITKLISMTPQENGFAYRNREIVEKLIHEFPGSSINFSPYENDNISVTGPVNIIGQIHKNVLDGIRSAIGNQYASTKKETSPETSPGRLSSELDSLRPPEETSDSISTEPVAPPVSTPVSISFDTSAELEAIDSGYNPAAKRHQHSLISTVSRISGPPPGYSDAESVSSEKPEEMPTASTPTPVSSSVPNDSWSAPSTRPPNSNYPDYVPPFSTINSSINTTSPSSGLQANPSIIRQPNLRPPSRTRPPNSSIPPSTIPPNFPNVRPVASFEDMLQPSPRQPKADPLPPSNSIPSAIPPTTNSSQAIRPPYSAPVTRSPKEEPAHSTRSPNSTIPGTRPPNMEYIPTTRLPVGGTSTATRPPVGGPSTATRLPVSGPSTATRPPVSGPSTATRPPVSGPSTATRPPVSGPSTATRPPVSGPSTATRPPVSGPSTATRPPNSDPDSAARSSPPAAPHASASPQKSGVASPLTTVNGSPASYNHGSNQNLSSSLYDTASLQAPNGFNWDILKRIPVDIPDLQPGSPEHWIYNVVREEISGGLVASIPITDLVKKFMKEFSVTQVNTANLTKEFYKCLKTRPRIFLTEVRQLPSGKKTINVTLNLPKQQMPPSSAQFVDPRHSTPPVSTSPMVPGAMTPDAMTPPQASIVSDLSRTPTTAPVMSTKSPSVTAVTSLAPVSQSSAPVVSAPQGAYVPPPMRAPIAQHLDISDSYPKLVSPPSLNHDSQQTAASYSVPEVNAPQGAYVPPPMRAPIAQHPDISDSYPKLVSTPSLNPDSQQTSDSYSNFEDMLYSPPAKSDQVDVLASDQAVPISDVVETNPTVTENKVSRSETVPQTQETPNITNHRNSDQNSLPVLNIDPSETDNISENTKLPESEASQPADPDKVVVADPDKVVEPLVPLSNPVWEPASSPETNPTQPESETVTPPSESDTIENSSSGASTIPQLPLQTSKSVDQTSSVSKAPPGLESIQNTPRSEHSSGSDYVVCSKSESELSGRSSGVLVDNLSVSSDAASSPRMKEDKLDETFTKLNLSSSESADHEEEEEKEEEEEEHYTTFFTSSRRTPCSIGISGDSTFLNVNAAQPSYILVHGGDAAAKNSIIKQIVEVWVKMELPVMVVSPELKSVSSHSDVDFYQFKTITGTEDLELVDRCEKFLTSESCSALKLLVINTVHKAMDTKEFLSVLAEQYEQFNVVVLTIAPPTPVDIATGLITTWRRVKKDKVLKEISSTFETELGPEVNQIKRGTLVSLSLDDDEIKPIVFTSLFGK
ncbi:uncharacterized protein LOC134819336 isoform X4 [Bolinopsis microptera]|uniref:uncharacterized protein LOC134819336 isoform X4 n=1 Tax=Bolinopsis microptera TaxID=2820187 RepID=UPI003078B93E